MIEQKNLRVIFTSEADFVLHKLLKKYGLEESEEEIFSKMDRDEDYKEKIVRDAAEAAVRKIIPEKNLTELLQIHLEMPQTSAENLLKDIQEELLPLIQMYPEEQFNNFDFREEISEKIFGVEGLSGTTSATKELIEKIRTHNATIKSKEELPTSHVKTPSITDVDKNAEKIKQERKPILSGGQNVTPTENPGVAKEEKPQTQETKKDTYRELID